jgi:hypothetical protein
MTHQGQRKRMREQKDKPEPTTQRVYDSTINNKYEVVSCMRVPTFMPGDSNNLFEQVVNK